MDPSVISLSLGSLVEINPKIIIAEIMVLTSCNIEIFTCFTIVIYSNRLMKRRRLNMNKTVNMTAIFLSLFRLFFNLSIMEFLCNTFMAYHI